MPNDLKEYDFRKCVEELNELATVLMQQINKPHKDLSEGIVEEMGDVLYRIGNMMDHYDRDLVIKRKNYKKEKFKEVRYSKKED
jgi:NTP pyrophosphatase (non-canonical NTP hydrolase)